jgi:hypothetical protein
MTADDDEGHAMSDAGTATGMVVGNWAMSLDGFIAWSGQPQAQHASGGGR